MTRARKVKDAPASPAGGEEPGFAQVWAEAKPGRLSKGVYSVYKTEEGGLHVSFRPEGAEEDSHLPVPPALLAVMTAATEGKGPFGKMRALAASMSAG